MDLSISKLQQLLTVARCRSISRAAVELNLSQPALSRSIAQIEERYGFAIFNRSGHGVAPTAAGLQVLEQAVPLLRELKVFESNLNLLGAGQGGRLEMGMAPLLASQSLQRFTAAFFDADCRARLRVMIRPGGELLEALRNDEIELLFCPESHLVPFDEIDIAPVGALQPVCVVRRDHPLLARGRLTIADLAEFPWASSVELASAPVVPSAARLICDNYHVLREAVLATDLVCICSTDFVAAELRAGDLAEIHAAGLPLPPTPIVVARLKGRIDSPLARTAVIEVTRHLSERSEP